VINSLPQVAQGHVFGKQEVGEPFVSRDCLGYMTVNINFFLQLNYAAYRIR